MESPTSSRKKAFLEKRNRRSREVRRVKKGAVRKPTAPSLFAAPPRQNDPFSFVYARRPPARMMSICRRQGVGDLEVEPFVTLPP